MGLFGTTDWDNWSGNQQQNANVEVEKPENLAQLKAALTRARVQPERTVRVVGTTHAWAELIANDDEPLTVIDLTKWSKAKDQLRIDRHDDTATFPAGWRLDYVTKLLAKRGYQLHSPPVYSKMNIGGLLGTASHGTGDRHTETMSDHLVGFRMLLADESEIHIDKDEPLRECDRELLKAVRCSLGALGIVYQVTLHVAPSFYVREQDALYDVQETLDQLDEVVGDNEFVEMFWVPFTHKMWVKAYNQVERFHYGLLNRFWHWFTNLMLTLFQATIYNLMLWTRKKVRWQWRYRPMLRLLGRLIPTGDRVIPASSAFHFQRSIPKIIALAYVVDQKNIVRLWRYLMARINEAEMRGRYPVNIMVESRFIRRSAEAQGSEDAGNYVPAVLLSPAVYDKTAYVEIVGYAKTEEMLEFFDAVEKGILENFEFSRPHWGKYFVDAKDLAHRYNDKMAKKYWRMARFLRVREQLDPTHVMSNRFLNDEVFTGPTAPPPDFDELQACSFRGHGNDPA